MGRTSERRIPLSLNVPRALRDALDRRVEEGRAQGFPVERAALAVAALERGLAGGAPSPGRVPMTVDAEHAFLSLVTALEDLEMHCDGNEKALGAVAWVRREITTVRGAFG